MKSQSGLRSWSAPALPLLAALTGAACAPAATASGAASPSAPIVVFPSQRELAALPPTPVSGDAFATGVVAVDAWDFESLQPEGAAYEDTSPWGGLVDEVARSRPGAITLDPALRCAANEIARVQIKKQGLPTTGFRRFAVARCGGAVADTVVQSWTATLPAKATEADLVAHMHDEMAAVLEKALGAEPHQLFGFSAYREGREVRMVGVLARDEVRLETASRKVDSARNVTIRGTLRGEATTLTALVNQGATGVEHCTPDPTVSLPRFSATCHLAAGDDAAWVELAVQKKGRLLSTSLATLLVYAREEATQTYKDPAIDTATAAHSASELTASLLDRLNTMRRAAKLQPVTLAPKQTAENTRLAGNLVVAGSGEDGQKADTIALGLMAGWDVSGLIRDGRFYLGESAPARDAKAWLDDASTRPLARIALFDKATKQVAIGAVVPTDVPAVAVAFTAYSFFDTPNHDQEIEQLHTMLREARVARGLKPHVRVAQTPQLSNEVGRVRDNGDATLPALNRAIQSINETTGRSVSGFTVDAHDVAAMKFPDSILTGEAGYVAIDVTHHKAPGAAWGQLAIFVVMVHAPVVSDH